MSSYLPESLQKLIDEFSRLPGIGPKSAERLAIHLLHSPADRRESLGKSVLEFSKGLKFCETCWNISDVSPCKICADETRDHTVLCVVEQIVDVWALERSGVFKGIYHVLHGALSPIDAIGPEHLKLAELEMRIQKGGINEVIVGTNPSVEGEATALYISKLLESYPVKLTRLARGLPTGGELHYADEVTLARALQGRQKI